jgi:hypothetical protein
MLAVKIDQNLIEKLIDQLVIARLSLNRFGMLSLRAHIGPLRQTPHI